MPKFQVKISSRRAGGLRQPPRRGHPHRERTAEAV